MELIFGYAKIFYTRTAIERKLFKEDFKTNELSIIAKTSFFVLNTVAPSEPGKFK